MELGISFEECREHILNLTPEDFRYITNEDNVCGPDRWVFEKEICGKTIYIRLRMNARKDRVICESFHD